MVFSSLLFIFLFLPLNLCLYYSTKNRVIRNSILIVFSLVFYAWGEPIWVSLLIISALIDYLNGRFIDKYRGTNWAKLGIYSTLLFNIGLLATFKYASFIIENVNAIFSTHFGKPGFMLPIGISFYTFQTISYTLDVYRGEVKAQKSFWNFLLFVSLYHQLVAGPIVRYAHIDKEIAERTFSWNDFSNGVTRFCKGLFKKICIANIAGSICAQFLEKDLGELTVVGGWYGILMFTIQIYFDFSGYSDMAIGLGWMFGFHYHENFKHPYLSVSMTDFWRRWHISLGSFFRDYIYIPLGGNRRHYLRNIFIVWATTGLWHGASWNYVIWGLYFGILLYLEKLFINVFFEKLPVVFRHIYALFLIIIGWGIFYFTDLSKLCHFFATIFNFKGARLVDLETLASLRANMFWLVIAIALCLPVRNWFEELLEKHVGSIPVKSTIHISLNLFFFFISVTLLVGSSYNPFLYFRF